MKKHALNFLIQNKNENEILKTIYDMYQSGEELDINKISTNSFISKSGVTRFFKQHGWSGFVEFKYLLINDEWNNDNFNIDDSFEEEIIFRPIQVTKSLNHIDKYKKSVDMIENANSIFISTVGGNIPVGYELQTRLERFGFHANFHTDSHLNYVKISNGNVNDILIAISYSGETPEILKTQKVAKAIGMKVISITCSNTNSLSSASDLSLLVDHSENMLRIMALKSRMSMFYIIYKLTLEIYSKNREKYDRLLLRNIYPK